MVNVEGHRGRIVGRGASYARYSVVLLVVNGRNVKSIFEKLRIRHGVQVR